jgi:transcriptional regulator with XRE-family HTH domain
MSSKGKLPEISLAVKAVREASRMSQEGFAQSLRTTSTSISRIERGVQTLASFDMLNRLEKMARDLGLEAEAALFDQGRSALRFTAYRPPPPERQDAGLTYPLPQWRLAMAARIATAYFPERLPAIEEALRPAIGIVDDILLGVADDAEINYAEMEREVFSRAERRKLQDLKREAFVPEKENQ